LPSRQSCSLVRRAFNSGDIGPWRAKAATAGIFPDLGQLRGLGLPRNFGIAQLRRQALDSSSHGIVGARQGRLLAPLLSIGQWASVTPVLPSGADAPFVVVASHLRPDAPQCPVRSRPVHPTETRFMSKHHPQHSTAPGGGSLSPPYSLWKAAFLLRRT